VREADVKGTWLVVALALAAPALARAQDAAPPLQENPKAVHFNDVERGFFVGFDAGYLSFLETPTAEPDKFPYAGDSGGRSGGALVALEIGKDFSTRLSAALILQGGSQTASPSYGSFSIYSVGADVRWAFYGTRDRNDWERFFMYLHARGGYAMSYPKGLFGTSEILVQAGPGVEYFTRLRHFSVGLAADYVYATKAKAGGFAVYPTVRYTF
jgi:hypothetical protein